MAISKLEDNFQTILYNNHTVDLPITGCFILIKINHYKFKTNMKKDNIIYWVSTIIFFLFDTVMPALTFNTELAKEGIRHLGYPDYFRVQLTVFKIIGGILLILPMVPQRIKEWAYAGFGISLISAFTGHWVVDGIGFLTFFPLIIFAILAVSYFYYHKIKNE